MKILFFFPKSLAQSNAGSKTRAMYLLKYFRHRGLEVDFAGLTENPSADSITTDMLVGNHLAQNVFLLDRKPPRANFLSYFFKYKIANTLYHWLTYPLRSSIPPFLTIHVKKEFENILRHNKYDYIIISYADCADLVSNKSLTGPARTIIDTHDFLTAQFKYKRRFNLGATFQDEISRLNLFDEIWAISVEEQYVFKQFCKALVRLVPMMMDAPQKAEQQKVYDLIYVAGDNPHNVRSAEWLFKQVYPLLPAGLKLCVIGDIVNHIPDLEGVHKVPRAESLDSYYSQSRIALCPMLSGTGVKVKVVEALAHGLPVACTLHGIDGLANKINNGCLVSDIPDEFAHNIMTLLSDAQLYEQQSIYAEQLFLQSFETGMSFKVLDKAFNNEHTSYQ